MKKLIYKIFSNKRTILVSLLAFLIIIFVGIFTIDINMLDINFGIWYTIIHIIFHILLSLLVAWIVAIKMYTINQKENIENKKISNIWLIPAIIGTILTWCPVCSVTLVSALWLTTILSFLPRYWLELKILSVFVLFWTQDIMIWNIDWCKLFKRKKWFLSKSFVYSIIVLILVFFATFFVTQEKNYTTIMGWVVVYPSDDYNVFSYSLQEGCSDKSYYLESFTQNTKDTKINWISVYDLKNIQNFEICSKERWIEWDINQEKFFEIIQEYKNSKKMSKLKNINNTLFLQKNIKCEDYLKPYCLGSEYWLYKNNLLYKVLVETIDEKEIEKEYWNILMDQELSKWFFY